MLYVFEEEKACCFCIWWSYNFVTVDRKVFMFTCGNRVKNLEKRIKANAELGIENKPLTWYEQCAGSVAFVF